MPKFASTRRDLQSSGIAPTIDQSLEENVMMKLFTLVCLVTLGLYTASTECVAQTSPTPSPSGLETVCPKIREVKPGFIYKNSAPLRSGGVGTALVGYRREPTLICMTRGVCGKSTRIYDSAGTVIGSCPWASAHDAPGGRFRCTMKTANLRKKAVQNTGEPDIYFRLLSDNCAHIPDAGRCYGSVKGLCGQLIK